MRAAVIPETGALPLVSDVPAPEPAPGQATLAVTHVALNPVEIRVAAGRMGSPETPYVPGLEGVGTVLRSERFSPGTRVRFENDLPGFGKNGAMSGIAVAGEESMTELPDQVSDAEGAAAGVVGITALLALRRAGLVAGEKVVVLGATGGVGQMAVQLSSLLGAGGVVAVGRDRETLDRLLMLGAGSTVCLTEIDLDELPAVIRRETGGGADVVVDTLWGHPAMAALESLSDEGRLVNVGNSAGTEVELPLQAMRRHRSAVIGLSSGWSPLEDKMGAYRRVVQAMTAGEVTVAHEVVPLDGVAGAWSRQKSSPHRRLVVSLA